MLAAMSSCLVDGFLLLMVVALFVVVMVFVSLAFAVAFHAMVACTYMPNASWRRRGGKAQGRGISHPEQSGGQAKRRSAQAKRGRLRETLAPRQGSALSEVWSPHTCAFSAPDFRVALRQEQAAEVGAENAPAVEAREESSSRLNALFK